MNIPWTASGTGTLETRWNESSLAATGASPIRSVAEEASHIPDEDWPCCSAGIEWVAAALALAGMLLILALVR